MEKNFPNFQLITQNVDGLHQRAGSRNVVELHGNITRTKCYEEGTIVSRWRETGDVPPKCPNCGGLLRPDVVWFEESLPEANGPGQSREHELRRFSFGRNVHGCSRRATPFRISSGATGGGDQPPDAIHAAGSLRAAGAGRNAGHCLSVRNSNPTTNALPDGRP
jgi:hypothetical protein